MLILLFSEYQNIILGIVPNLIFLILNSVFGGGIKKDEKFVHGDFPSHRIL